MSKVFEHFKTISATPRCSRKAELMKEVIISFAKSLDFEVKTDKYSNVLCKKGNPNICLQAHYDMVCIGDTNPLELIVEENILSAKNSSLGADNGMGMAIMFTIMEKFSNVECLFTSDEEIGLIGASNLELQIHSSKLLNLDGEQEEDIYVGCAGGVDVVSKLNLEYIPLEEDECIYEISALNLTGGHSGVDIDKNITSAIKILAKELVKHDLKLLHVEGGEFRNSISKNAKAIVSSKEKIDIKDELISIKKVEFERKYIKNGNVIMKALDAFAHGVRSYDKNFMIPSTSINLGVIRLNDGILRIDCSVRGMSDEDMIELARQTQSFFSLLDFSTKQNDFHSAWIPNIGEFAHQLKSIMLEKFENSEFKAIHAGLECGILIQKQSKPIEAVAIGPTIRYPHSTREECDLDSVERIYSVVEQIMEDI